MDRSGRDALLALLAQRQAGAFTYAQALAAGFPNATIGRRTASGAWARLHPGVYVLAGAPSTRRTALWGAVLAAGPGAVVSHESAALLHGAERLQQKPITLTNPHRAHHRLATVFVHQIDDLVAAHRTEIDGLPVSRPARAVVELAASQPAATIGRVADDLVRLRKTTYGGIAAVFGQVLRPGKPGLVKVARVLEERGDGHVPPASELERALFDALDAGGLPPPTRQLPLPGRGGISGIADGGYLDAQMILEADGRRWHSRVEAARADRARDAQVVRAGWVPLRFVYEQIVHDPAEVCAIVAETRALRLELLGRRAA
jgi:hypothetical protein